jgi:hypothetical protein
MEWRSNEMTRQTPYFTKTIFITTCLLVGCTGGGAAGCSGDSGSEPPPTIDSSLLGVYAIDSYQGSPLEPVGEDSCEQLSDLDHLDFLVLYSFRPNDKPDEARLGGFFCETVDSCEEGAALAPEPVVGYSFIEGNDDDGWRGFGIARGGPEGDQCRADVQIHLLSSDGSTLNIITDTVRTIFPPIIDGDTATCRNSDALGSLTPELPCRSRFVLKATRYSDR